MARRGAEGAENTRRAIGNSKTPGGFVTIFELNSLAKLNTVKLAGCSEPSKG